MDLGRMSSTGEGTWMLLAAILLLATAGIFVLVTIGLFVHDVPRGEYERPFVTGFALLGTTPVCVIVAALLLRRRSCWVVLHEHGMVAATTLGAPLVLPWWDVLELLPPPIITRNPSFEVRTRADRRLGISRLRCPPRLTLQGYRMDPDVALVLDHYVLWCRRHGQMPRIGHSMQMT